MYWLAACLVVAGCGRFGFDEIATDADGDAPIVALELTPPRFATSSTEFVDVPDGTLTIPPSPGQTWLLLVSAALESSSLSYAAPEARYLVDGVERGLGGTESVATDRPGPWQHFYMFDGGSAPTTITFQARDALGAVTVLDQLRVVAMPVPADAAPLTTSYDAPLAVMTTAYSTVASFALTVTRAGEYVLLLQANGTEAPATSNVEMFWVDPAGQTWSHRFQTPRGAWQSHLIVRRLTLAPGTTTFELRARSGSSAQIRYARVAALAIDGLASFEESTTTTVYMTASPAMTISHELSPRATAAGAVVVLGTMRVNDDCANLQLAHRAAHFLVDGETYSTMHAAGNCAYFATYGFVDLRAEAPSYVAASISSGNAQNVVTDESSLVVFGVR